MYWLVDKSKVLKQNLVLRKKEALYFCIFLGFLIYLGATIWAFGLAVYVVLHFSSGAKPLSVREFYKTHLLNRKYLRIKHFWKHNFLQNYLKLPIKERIWQLLLLLVISFYNALSTRYMFISTIFYARCGIYLFVFGNLWGLYLIFLYFLPLVLLTFICGRPAIAHTLNQTYGKITIKKLGFNML